jgi:hypothetical protein
MPTDSLRREKTGKKTPVLTSHTLVYSTVSIYDNKTRFWAGSLITSVPVLSAVHASNSLLKKRDQGMQRKAETDDNAEFTRSK